MFLWCTINQAIKVRREKKDLIPSAAQAFSVLGCSGWWGVNDMSICPVWCEDPSFSLSVLCTWSCKGRNPLQNPIPNLCLFDRHLWDYHLLFIQFSSKGYSSLHFIYSTAFSEASELLELKPSLISAAFHLVSQSLKCFSPVKISEI